MNGNFLPTFRDNPSAPSSGGLSRNVTSVRNYHYSQRNNPEERSSHLLHGGTLKSRTAEKHVWTSDTGGNTGVEKNAQRRAL